MDLSSAAALDAKDPCWEANHRRPFSLALQTQSSSTESKRENLLVYKDGNFPSTLDSRAGPDIQTSPHLPTLPQPIMRYTVRYSFCSTINLLFN